MKDMDEFYTEDDKKIGIKHCDGFDIYYNLYGEGEYSVDGYWYPTLESAMHPIKNRTDKRPLEDAQRESADSDEKLDHAFMEFEQKMQKCKKQRRRYNWLLLLVPILIAAIMWTFTAKYYKLFSICSIMLVDVLLNHMILISSIGSETPKKIVIADLVYLNVNSVLTAMRVFANQHIVIVSITASQVIGFLAILAYVGWDYYKRRKSQKQQAKELNERLEKMMQEITAQQKSANHDEMTEK